MRSSQLFQSRKAPCYALPCFSGSGSPPFLAFPCLAGVFPCFSLLFQVRKMLRVLWKHRIPPAALLGEPLLESSIHSYEEVPGLKFSRTGITRTLAHVLDHALREVIRRAPRHPRGCALLLRLRPGDGLGSIGGAAAKDILKAGLELDDAPPGRRYSYLRGRSARSCCEIDAGRAWAKGQGRAGA